MFIQEIQRAETPSFDFLMAEIEVGRLVVGPIFAQHGSTSSALLAVCRSWADVVVNEADGVMCRPGPNGRVGTVDDMFDRLRQIYVDHRHKDSSAPFKMVVKFMAASWPPGIEKCDQRVFQLGVPVFMVQHLAPSMETRLLRSCKYFKARVDHGYITATEKDIASVNSAIDRRWYADLPDGLLAQMTSYYADRFDPYLDFINRYAPGVDDILGLPDQGNLTEHRNFRDVAVEFVRVYQMIREYRATHPGQPVHILDGTAFQACPDFYLGRLTERIWRMPGGTTPQERLAPVVNDYDAITHGPRALLSRIMFGDIFDPDKKVDVVKPSKNPLPPRAFPQAYCDILPGLVREYYAALTACTGPMAALPYPQECDLPSGSSDLARFNCRLLNNPDQRIGSFLSQAWQTVAGPLKMKYVWWALQGAGCAIVPDVDQGRGDKLSLFR
jgi:hypothetical protein